MEGHLVRADMHGDMAALRHFERVPEQREAGHIRATVHRIFHHDVACGLVERRHLAVDALHERRVCESAPRGGRDDADAERLCQDEDVARLCAAVREHLFRMHEARNRKAVNRLRALDGVAAGDDRAGLVGLVRSRRAGFPAPA